MVADPAPLLRRDRLTWLVYLQTSLFGYFIYAFGPTVPLLHDEQRTSKAVSGLHGTALAAGTLVAGVVGPIVVRRFGRRVAMWGAQSLLVAGTVIYTLLPALPGTLAGVAVAGTGGSLLISAVNGILNEHQADFSSTAMSESNAFSALVGLMAPLLVGAAVTLGIGWRPAMYVLVIGAVALGAVFRTMPIPPPAAAVAGAASGRLPGRFWIAWTVLAGGIAIEYCLTLWSTDILRARDGMGSGAAATGVTAIVAGLAVGRMAGARLTRRIALPSLLLGAYATTAAGFLLFWLPTSAVAAMTGLFVAGLGVALLFPLATVLIVTAAGGRTDLALGRGAIAAALAVGAGPFILGAIADQVGTHTAFLVVPVLVLVGVGGVVLEQRLERLTRAVS